MTERLARVELAFSEGLFTGAQAIFEVGIIVEGEFVSTGQPRTTGLNTGQNPEYDQTLADVLGPSLTAALGANEALTAHLGTVTSERDTLTARVAELEALLAAQPA
jgi:hypothetical protein